MIIIKISNRTQERKNKQSIPDQNESIGSCWVSLIGIRCFQPFSFDTHKSNPTIFESQKSYNSMIGPINSNCHNLSDKMGIKKFRQPNFLICIGRDPTGIISWFISEIIETVFYTWLFGIFSVFFRKYKLYFTPSPSSFH